jgi:two-component system, OmpR family, sensor kinase
MSRFFQSLRWRLQLWHGAMLLLVLAAFGSTAFYLARDTRLRRIDQELQRHLSELMGVLRPPPPGRPGPPFGPRGRRGDGLVAPESQPEPDRPWMFPRPFPVRLPPDLLARFAGRGPAAFYYVIWSPHGVMLQRSTNAPAAVPMPEGAGPPIEFVRTRGELREWAHADRHGLRLIVGRSIGPDLAELRRLAWLLALAGLGVLALGLAGGWWLATRAIRPIADISRTARMIAGGNLTERVGIAQTDSELGQLAQVLNTTFDRLQAAFARQAQFTTDASHELRTPVTVILSQAQTALARERGAGEYREAVEACQRAAQRMRQLIESLLVLARVDSGDSPVQRVPCALDQVTKEAVSLVKPLAAEHHITLVTNLASATCAGDAEQLGRVVLNLVGNAIHYNRPGGSVQVSLTTEDRTAVLRVTDTGHGIADEDLPHIFDRFYRADKSRARPQGRTGLGLAIVKAIVDAHGGRVQVDSRPNQGSTFSVWLPRDPALTPPDG